MPSIFALKENTDCPIFLSLEEDARKEGGGRVAKSTPLCLSSGGPAATGNKPDQERQMISPLWWPCYGRTGHGFRHGSAVDSSILAYYPAEGSPLPSGRLNLAPSARAMKPSCVAPRWGLRTHRGVYWTRFQRQEFHIHGASMPLSSLSFPTSMQSKNHDPITCNMV